MNDTIKAKPEHLLFLTGRLAEKQLQLTLERMQPEFTYTIHQLGVKVAALMTTDMIARRLNQTFNADKIIIPGRCLGDTEALSQKVGLPVERGPEELKDLPLFFGKAASKLDLSRYKVKIFAEIVDAPKLTVEETLERAHHYQNNGANVIDIGCLPQTPFPHLAEVIRTLKQEAFTVSIDSLLAEDLITGAKAGADYMLSLSPNSLWIADEVDSIPIIIPEPHTDLASLDGAIATLQAKNKPFIVDPILDPIHFGFTESIVRNYNFRQRYPAVEMMLGVGNITELTHADTAGINTLLLGLCSELNINHILATQVSQHACRAIKEADYARRIMSLAQQNNTLPKHIDSSLMTVHDPAPFPYQLSEINDFAAAIRDPSFRIQTSIEGMHIYNRDGLHTATEPFALFPKLQVNDDASHAFYLGVQLARAQISWQLGKRFTQDQPLAWGCAVEHTEQTVDVHNFKPATTAPANSK